MTATQPKEGKIELRAACDGLFQVDVERLYAVNSQEELMIATRHTNTPVKAGDKLAGMRVIPLVIAEDKLRAAEAAAAASLRDAAYFQERTAQVVRTRQRTALALRDMGFAVTDSQANFLFVRHPQVPAKTLLDGLRERGILVRWFDRPRIRDYLRITVGTDGEMDALTAALKKLTEV